MSPPCFHRRQPLLLTQSLPDLSIPTFEATGTPVTVKLAIGDVVISVSVVETYDRPDDPLCRTYQKADGQREKQLLPSYHVDRVHELEEYIRTMDTDVLRMIGLPGDLQRAWRYVQGQYPHVFRALLQYISGSFLVAGSAYLDGDETLGIVPVPLDAKTHAGKCGAPRGVSAVIERLVIRQLDQKAAELFGETGAVLALLRSDNTDATLPGYLLLRMLAHWANFFEADRRRVGEENGTEVSLRDDVENVWASLDILLNEFRGRSADVHYADLIKSMPCELQTLVNQEVRAGRIIPALRDICRPPHP